MEHTPTQNRFLSDIKEKLRESTTPFLYVIQGAAGSGKTTISNELHREFSLVAYSFDNCNAIKDFISKPSMKGFKTFIMRNGKPDDTGGNWLTWFFLALVLIPISFQLIGWIITEFYIIILRKRSRRNISGLFSDKDQSIFYIYLRNYLRIRKYKNKYINFLIRCFTANKKHGNPIHNVLIFDDVNFYEDKEIQYIIDLFYNKQLQETSSVFSSVGIVINYCPDYNVNPRIKSFMEKLPPETLLKLPSYSEEDIDFLCSKYNDQTCKLVKKNLPKIKNISLHSNLALVTSLINYIDTHRDADDNKIVNGYCFDHREHYEVFKKYIYKEMELWEVFKLLSLTPDEVLLKEIIELRKLRKEGNEDKESSGMEVRKIIFKASKRHFIFPEAFQLFDSERTSLCFVEDQFKEYFKPKDENFIKIFYSQYADVIKIVSPGDYAERAVYYELSGESEKAALFRFMHFVQACYTDTVNEIEDTNMGRYQELALLLKEAYHLYYRGKFQEIIPLIDHMNKFSMEPLARFEQEFLKCKIDLVSADKNKMKEIRKVMNRYRKCIEVSEKEIHVRINLVMYLVELYDGNNSYVKQLENAILSDTSVLSRVYGKYDYHKYSIQRRAIISNEIEKAHELVEESVNYFYRKTQHCSSTFFMREYFCSLINFSATYRYQADYGNAYKQAQKALRIYDDFPDDFPKSTLFNTMAITGFESGNLTGEEAINLYLQPLEREMDIHESSDSTDYFILNNMACIYAYTDLEQGLEYIEKALRVMNNATESINNHKYRLYINKAVLLFVKNDPKGAVSLIEEIRNLQTFSYSSVYHLGKYNTLRDIFMSSERVGSIVELDELMEKRRPSRTNIHRHYNKSLHLWSLQYWSR